MNLSPQNGIFEPHLPLKWINLRGHITNLSYKVVPLRVLPMQWQAVVPLKGKIFAQQCIIQSDKWQQMQLFSWVLYLHGGLFVSLFCRWLSSVMCEHQWMINEQTLTSDQIVMLPCCFPCIQLSNMPNARQRQRDFPSE